MGKGASGKPDRAGGLRPEPAPQSQPKALIPSAELQSISAWPERRPLRTESERAAIAARFAAHLPLIPRGVVWSDDDLNAMRAAFIRRFDEELPRTETLMCVAAIGYRAALRDAQAIEARRAETQSGSVHESAVPEGNAP